MKQILDRGLQAPNSIVLFLWMVVLLTMVIYFSAVRHYLSHPEHSGLNVYSNYKFFEMPDRQVWGHIKHDPVRAGGPSQKDALLAKQKAASREMRRV